MIFQKKVDRALDKLHEDSDAAKEEREREEALRALGHIPQTNEEDEEDEI